MNKWTIEETTILRDNYNKLSNYELLQLFPNRTLLGIYKKAYKMGMHKSQDIIFINRSEARKGEKGSNWKGGISKTNKGYKLIKMPNHNKANKHGYVLEHIFIFENETGINIPKNCCIHHINGNKSDNRIENLCLMLTSAHTKYHNLGRQFSDETKHKMSIKAKERYKKNE